MDIDQAAVFLAGSILTGLGFVIVTITIVAINNIIHKYWKSFGWKFVPAALDQPPMRFVEPEEFKKK